MQPLGGGQVGGRVSGALGLPPPPPPPPGEVFLWGHHADSSFGVASAWGQRLRFDTSRGPAERAALLPSALPRSDGLDVAMVSLGSMHGALLSRDGQVFTWGRSDHGRLGHGSQHHVAAPALLESLAGTRVLQLACSDTQTAAVTDDGTLLVWGQTSLFGVLGHSSFRTQWMPRAVHGPLQGVVVRQVATGPWHSALVTADGVVFTWGEGTFGELGHGDCQAQLLPRRVEALAGYSAVQVACGVWHTAALARSARAAENAQVTRLFTWGDGDKGQLGDGRKGGVPTPVCIDGELAGQSIKQACAVLHWCAAAVQRSC